MGIIISLEKLVMEKADTFKRTGFQGGERKWYLEQNQGAAAPVTGTRT